MRIITYKRIVEFSDAYPNTKVALAEWHKKVQKSNWSCFADVRKTFNSADSIGNNRFVFNVKGNNYRIVSIIIFASQKVYIRFIGTHNEYSKMKDCSTL